MTKEIKSIDYWQDQIDKNRKDPEKLYIISLKVLALAAKRSLEFKPEVIPEDIEIFSELSEVIPEDIEIFSELSEVIPSEHITTKDGLLFYKGERVPLPKADKLARIYGYAYAENLVAYLER